MPPPSLLLSVIGGTQNWKGEDLIEKAFLKGIVNLIRRTPNVWILTEGVNQGKLAGPESPRPRVLKNQMK